MIMVLHDQDMVKGCHWSLHIQKYHHNGGDCFESVTY